MKPAEQSDTSKATPAPPQRRRDRRVLGFLARGAALAALLFVMGWSSAALWFDGPAARWLAGILVVLLLAACAGTFWFMRRFWRAVLIDVCLFGLVLIWWLLIPPRNDRDWQADVAKLATATFHGNVVRIDNIRNFDYRSNGDYTERWESRTYDLDQIVGFDLFLSFWGPTDIAHTIASWEFDDGRHLAISIETRKEKGEDYSAVLGFFRQFELYYVVADEQDVIGVRASHRGEHVRLYRFTTPRDTARALLIDYLESVNKLAVRPKWYNALADNCTTMIRYHFKHVAAVKAFSWKFLLNGYLDELLYDRGAIDTSLPLAELRRRSDVTERAKAAAGDPAFSRRIRDNLPVRQTQETNAERANR
jgi:hypothetical protein